MSALKITSLILSTILSGQAVALASDRQPTPFEADIIKSVTQNLAVEAGNDSSVSLAKIKFEDGDEEFVAFVKKNFVGKTKEGFTELYVRYFFLKKEAGQLRGSIFWQTPRFIVDKGDAGQEYIGKGGIRYPIIVTPVDIKTVEFKEPGRLSKDIKYFLKRTDESSESLSALLADRPDLSGPFGSCSYNELGKAGCYYMKKSQCNYSGALELADFGKSTTNFTFRASENCPR